MEEDGWGGRDRTCEWRHQKPLPYRLATPHHLGFLRDQVAEASCAAAAL
jgi:hypothetical protein